MTVKKDLMSASRVGISRMDGAFATKRRAASWVGRRGWIGYWAGQLSLALWQRIRHRLTESRTLACPHVSTLLRPRYSSSGYPGSSRSAWECARVEAVSRTVRPTYLLVSHGALAQEPIGFRTLSDLYANPFRASVSIV